MDWNHYLLEEKSPHHPYADLGVMEGMVSGIYDLALVPKDTQILSLTMPLKKYHLTYSHDESLYGNKCIEGVCLSEVNVENVKLLSTLPNLKYLKISNNKQETILDLTPLRHLEVLILSDITKVTDFSFLFGLDYLKTLYLRDVKQLYDLSFLSNMTNLQELFLSNGGMSGVGKPVKSMAPLSNLKQLQYLHFALTVEHKNYDISPILSLKNLKYLTMLPRYYRNHRLETLQKELPDTIIE
ncbi:MULTISPECIES: leucine-rich repeat domain-containing protein [Bacillota]|jgi:Leucine-rich repeat (LRR) protein|uniref:Leucine-rich repeat domain-containing protein n=2 Tax=Amedibacillus TaxID=2749846 RepID=A0A7G9GTE4_9FIRM|nr:MULTISPECIES: leucine-rich repeat domain-containing protein [Bacillota]QNM14076.1 leucine-rich repeat domain-containing protein [[Eubacterium] hominis]MCH4285795.1 leucine-rich repeat domain-containing protein [Amedibacillus hominis]RGB51083.1 leucine-rich repeat domain-containing protein [Absiella sp. AM22-9]RGB56332.1 leucine-rich repeat domain-containing protein [Absiella sp. AM10-20]RGC50680.1 leucine-rich repeat domain-containing protein [Absiella sp. AM29-15]